MSKDLKEHEDINLHISKVVFGNLALLIIGLPLLINNVYLIVKAYPDPIFFPFVGFTSAALWIFVIYLMNREIFSRINIEE